MVITYNAALNRPAYQSNIHNNIYGRYPPHLANDGSRHTGYRTGTRCAVTNRETNPWWAVDLGRPTTIYRVDLTNKGDGGGSVNMFNVTTEFILPTENSWHKRTQYSIMLKSDLLS